MFEFPGKNHDRIILQDRMLADFPTTPLIKSSVFRIQKVLEKTAELAVESKQGAEYTVKHSNTLRHFIY